MYTYWVTKRPNSFIYELRQLRYKELYDIGCEHPHDVCAVARSVEEMKSMVEGIFTKTIDWSGVEQSK